jgi:hypothetical protein
MWRPRWFDGVALVLGSTAPDLPYAAVGVLPYTPSAHNLLGILLWCLPVTLLGCRLVRWAAPVVAAHLPRWARDYGVLGVVRHRWYVTVASALSGAASHLLWDGFTHHPEGFQGWASRLWPALTAEPVPGTPWWWVLQQSSTVLGALVTLGFVVSIARGGLLTAWHGQPPPVPVRPRVFWTATLATTAALASVALLAASRSATLDGVVAVTGVRLLLAGGLGLLAGAGAILTGSQRAEAAVGPRAGHAGRAQGADRRSVPRADA